VASDCDPRFTDDCGRVCTSTTLDGGATWLALLEPRICKVGCGQQRCVGNGGFFRRDVRTLSLEDLPCRRLVRRTERDDGFGIDDEALPRIFEPGFTTSAVGVGSARQTDALPRKFGSRASCS
jgi:hypothetical protein